MGLFVGGVVAGSVDESGGGADVFEVFGEVVKGGDGGGYIIAQGTPEIIAQVPESYTGMYLKPLLVRAAAHPMEEEHHRRQQARKVSEEALEISTSAKPRRKNAYNSKKG